MSPPSSPRRSQRSRMPPNWLGGDEIPFYLKLNTRKSVIKRNKNNKAVSSTKVATLNNNSKQELPKGRKLLSGAKQSKKITKTTTTATNASVEKKSTKKIAPKLKQVVTKKNNKKNGQTSNTKSVPKKTLSAAEAIKAAIERLNASSLPDILPCRESHFEEIYNFVEGKLFDNEGGCMYISGVPGTGKTTTLYEVKRKLEQCKHLPAFEFIEINGVRLGDPKQFYVHLLMELTGQKRNNTQAFSILNERFSNGSANKKFLILLVDELDFLRTKTQNLLYNIFDWPKRKNSKLLVLSIANTMDLPERFMLKFSSRIGFTRLAFQPYNFKELERIVRCRLADLDQYEVFESDALQLICRKVAALSGDARRVLDICRRSLEIAIDSGHTQVTLVEVDKALQEIFNSVRITRLRQAPCQEQIFLRALLQNFRMSGVEEACFIDVYKNHVEICRLEGQHVPTTSELAKVATNLDLSKIILFQKGISHLYRRISLNISPDDINFALNLIEQ